MFKDAVTCEGAGVRRNRMFMYRYCRKTCNRCTTTDPVTTPHTYIHTYIAYIINIVNKYSIHSEVIVVPGMLFLVLVLFL